MGGAIFMEQLKRGWLTTLYWGIGLGLLFFYIITVIQDATILVQYQQVIEQMPPAMMRAFGLSDAALLATPEGFVAFGGLGYSALILAVYGVLSGLNITANDEDEGILDVVLALPIPRWQVIVEKFLANIVMLISIIVMISIGAFLGKMTLPSGVSLDFGKIVIGAFNLIPGVLVIMGVTVLLASLISQKRIVTGGAAFFVIGSYFLNLISGSTTNEFANSLNNLSLFKYIDSEGAILHGVNPVNIVLLLTIAVLLLVISTFAFERRDIGL